MRGCGNGRGNVVAVDLLQSEWIAKGEGEDACLAGGKVLVGELFEGYHLPVLMSSSGARGRVF